MSALRAVFDVNILISARLSLLGNPFRCLALARAGEVQSITCAQILDEFTEKLVTKFGYPLPDARRHADEVAKFSASVPVPGNLKVVTTDPDDDPVLECAIVGKADCLVTGDHHLLAFKRYENVELVTATDFLLRVRQNLTR